MAYDWSGFDPSTITDSSTGWSLSNVLSSLGNTATDALAKMYKNADGSVNWKNVISTGAGLASLYSTSGGGGIAGALSGLFGSGGGDPVGYQGEIPKYTAMRATVPDALAAEAAKPGAPGRRYFSDVFYATPSNVSTARSAAETQATGIAALQKPSVEAKAAGGIAGLKKGRYLDGATDGMADKISTTIDGDQPAALSHGEFVIPADVVSHLGNGNSEAGAQKLYSMMDRIRQARTGTKKQGRQINPNKYMPA